MTLTETYRILMNHYGPQGWWPVKSSPSGVNDSGYHPLDFSFPRNSRERLEILLGAILTQNTSWRNVSMVLKMLIDQGLLDFDVLIKMPMKELAEKIRSAGYHNQKAKKIHLLLQFLKDRGFPGEEPPSRELLLELWGIGPETADSIRLYGYGQKEFVIDLYTRRILGRLGFRPDSDSYQSWKDYCISSLKADLEIYQEFHGLILAHGKEHCAAKPRCGACPFYDRCKSGRL